MEQLLNYGQLGFYSYCEVTQVILKIKSKKEYWNYFTNIECKRTFTKKTEREWLTSKPISINSNVQVLISKQVITIEDLKWIWNNAQENQVWCYDDDEAKLDNVFPVSSKFVPETDPTGSKISDNTLVPLELMLYGSNFNGNYYICELFSTKQYLKNLLSASDIEKVQRNIKKTHVIFDIKRLSDRIGNIICKLPVEVLQSNYKSLSPERGIRGTFTKDDAVKVNKKYNLQIICENDLMLIENRIISFTLDSETKSYEFEIPPNHYKNTIIVSDTSSGIVHYMAIRDYSFGSDYYSTITPPQYIIQAALERTINVNGKQEKINLNNISGSGEIFLDKEVCEIELRKQLWRDSYSNEHCFFSAYRAGDQIKAKEDIINIINDKELLWDLKEIWLIDPYLSAQDILETVVYSKKYQISLKCLTNIGAINRNVCTRGNDMLGFKTRFEETKKKYYQQLYKAIPQDSDLGLEFRTIHGNCGGTFHDRYLILKYGINKCRAWSLGISVNSLGASHHIVQIVETPTTVSQIIEEIWNQTSGDECLIYKH